MFYTLKCTQSISPGFVDTEIFDAAKVPHVKMKGSDILSSEEMADMIAFVMSTGPNILVILLYVIFFDFLAFSHLILMY